MVFILLRFDLQANLKIRRIPATCVIQISQLSFETNFQFVGKIPWKPREWGWTAVEKISRSSEATQRQPLPGVKSPVNMASPGLSGK
ncbi:hypothetical protein [Burkholderia ambifaria]|uniref:hypothetical protein n=1 Tax=Burkholderia ambifaria TaxID=152480 RepID=UPI001A9CA7EF|nr:hypothetical protein [Burkholderia ambifaria]